MINTKAPSVLPTSTLIADEISYPISELTYGSSATTNAVPTLTVDENGHVVSAALEIQSTDGALLVPRMTTAQRDDLIPFNGMLIYNVTTDGFNLYVDGEWVSIISAIEGDGAENHIVVFSNIAGILRDSGVPIDDVIPFSFNPLSLPEELTPGNNKTIKNLSFVQFLSGSGYVFLGTQAGLQVFEQPFPQNICTVVTQGDIPAGPSSVACALEINTRFGALLLSRMLQADVDNLEDKVPRDGMVLFNETPKIMQLRRLGDSNGADGVWANVSTNPQNLKSINSDYTVLFTDDVIAINSIPGFPIRINLPNNPRAGQSYIIYDATGNADSANIYADANTSINNVTPTYNRWFNISNTAFKTSCVMLTPGNERAWYGYDDTGSTNTLVTYMPNPRSETPGATVGIEVSGYRPRSIASSPSGNRGYVCCAGSNAVTEINNFSTGTPEQGLTTFVQDPLNIAISGDYAYVTTFGLGLFLFRNVNFGALIPLSPASINITAANQVIFSPDGRYAYVSSFGGFHQIKDANTNTPTLGVSIQLGDSCSALAVTKDGKYVYVGTSGSEKKTFVIQHADTDTPTLLGEFSSVACTDQGMTITENGKFLYICDMDSTNTDAIWIYRNADSGSPVLYKKISGFGGTPTSTLGPIFHPHAITTTEDGAYAYTADYHEDVGPGSQNWSSRIVNAEVLAKIIDDKFDGSQLIYNGSSWNAFQMPSKPNEGG